MTAKLKRIGSLQLDHDHASQRRAWTIERIGWIVFILLLMAAGLGFFGGVGPVNKASAANEDVEVNYQRYTRRMSPTEIEIKLKKTNENKAALSIESSFLDRYQIQEVSPEPSEVKAGSQMVTYEFSAKENADSVNVVFQMEPEVNSVGSVEGFIGISPDGFVKIKQFIYP